uniref:Putative secreted protein n=1 Tax=Ixodes ricinus TaxID=34613 RepID=A0A6B0V6S0_IXORI
MRSGASMLLGGSLVLKAVSTLSTKFLHSSWSTQTLSPRESSTKAFTNCSGQLTLSWKAARSRLHVKTDVRLLALVLKLTETSRLSRLLNASTTTSESKTRGRVLARNISVRYSMGSGFGRVFLSVFAAPHMIDSTLSSSPRSSALRTLLRKSVGSTSTAITSHWSLLVGTSRLTCWEGAGTPSRASEDGAAAANLGFLDDVEDDDPPAPSLRFRSVLELVPLREDDLAEGFGSGISAEVARCLEPRAMKSPGGKSAFTLFGPLF